MDLCICTTNAGKLAEFERLLGIQLEALSIEIDEIQAIDTEVVCRAKARAAFEQLGRPVIVDDTGFEIAALDGFPGALVTWALKSNDLGVLHRMIPPDGGSHATVVTSIGFASSAGVKAFSARVMGAVAPEPRGANGFGFDAVFIPEGADRTFAEMSDAEKDRHSPRAAAIVALGEYLGLIGR